MWGGGGVGGNNLPYLNHIIIMHYNVSYGYGQCLKRGVPRVSLQEGCRGSGWQTKSGGGNSSHGGSSKATPKKDGKGATTNSQGLSAPSASQTSPCHSGWGTSHHHKSKKDDGERWKKAADTSPAQKSTGHKARKDRGHH